MGKPTVLLDIDPFLIASGFIPSFIHQSVFMAHRLEDRLGGVSLKLSGSDSISIMGEFRWQGSTVIKVRNVGESTIEVSCPSRIIKPSTFHWGSLELKAVFDLAFVDVIERQIKKLNELKLDCENRELFQYYAYWDD